MVVIIWLSDGGFSAPGQQLMLSLCLTKFCGVVGYKAPPLPAVLLTCSWLLLRTPFLVWAYEGIASLDLSTSPWPSEQLYWTRPRGTPCWFFLLPTTHICPWKHSCIPCPNNPWPQHSSDHRIPPPELPGSPSLIPGFCGQVSRYNAPRPGATTGLMCLSLLDSLLKFSKEFLEILLLSLNSNLPSGPPNVGWGPRKVTALSKESPPEIPYPCSFRPSFHTLYGWAVIEQIFG